MLADHWNNNTVGYLNRYLAWAEKTVRIATGYFTIQGYDLIRQELRGKRVLILVGYEEQSRERLRKAVVDNLMAHLRSWNAPNRRQAVVELVGQLRRGELEIMEQRTENLDNVEARVRQRDHTKVYIIDDRWVLNGSSNLSRSGLQYNVEGMALVDDPERVRYWRDSFNRYWNDPNTISLTDQLLAALEAWLELDPPFDIYLKTIEALVSEEDIEPPRDNYRMPTRYQSVVISRALRSLRQHRGASIVASTGLGKTVMATHIAFMMFRRYQLICNVIVFAPKAVQANWEEALDTAGIAYKVYVWNNLDRRLRKGNRRQHEVQRIRSHLDRLDDQYLIIIDESHNFSNRTRQDGRERESFKVLRQAIEAHHPYVLTLTATPYSKDVADINNQLYLLPHTAKPNYMTAQGQTVMEAFSEGLVDPTAWRVEAKSDFFDQFTQLPVATVISTSKVARDFAVNTPEGDYVEFPSGPEKWIPRIAMRRISAPIPLEAEVTRLLEEGFFRHAPITIPTRGFFIKSDSIIEQEARTSWASSPLALAEVIEKTIYDEYEVRFMKQSQDRAETMMPVLEALRQWDYQDDAKLVELTCQLERLIGEDRKVVIFVERHASAVYLERGLADLMPDLRVGCTSYETEAGDYEKKMDSTILHMLYDFAPNANADLIRDTGHVMETEYEILITTDAFGVGVNMQDASVVVSYDLAWTPTPIIQRAGRILRLWKDPRDVFLYAFIPRLELDSPYRSEVSDVETRLRRLKHRTQVAEMFSELPVLPESDTHYPSLSGLASIEVEDIGLLDPTEVEEFSATSPFLRHYQIYSEFKKTGRKLDADLISALEYRGRTPRIYTLFRYKDNYEWAVMKLSTGDFETLSEDQLLEHIECLEATPTATVAPDAIEEAAQSCRYAWMGREHIVDDDIVERICALYLLPRQAQDLGEMLEKSIEVS